MSKAWIYPLLLLCFLTTSCNGQNQVHVSNGDSENNKSQANTMPSEQSNDLEKKGNITNYGAGDIIFCGLLDRAGNLWFGTSKEGVYRYDGKSFTNFTTRDGLCNNDVSSILEDRDGNIWLGTADGLCRYNGKTFTHVPIPWSDTSGTWLDEVYPIVNPNEITSILQDINGIFWLGTNGAGAYRYDGKTFTSFLANMGRLQTDSLHHNIVLSITEDNAGGIWFTSFTHGGVSRFDGTALTHFTINDGLSDDMIMTSFLDRSGNMWFGTRAGGLCRYDSGSGGFVNITEADGLCNNNVSCFYEDKSGALWLGSFSRNGVCIFDPSKSLELGGKTFTPFPKDGGPSLIDIRCIIEDKDGNLWFGGRYGVLWRYDGKTLTDFTQKSS